MLRIFSMVNLIVVAHSGIRCDCGYGGLCLEVPRPVMTDCSYWEKVSFGFYESDGHTIVDHCASNPCIAGDCESTFGGFFCRCPADRIGHRCELLRSGQWYQDFSSSEDVYVSYQVQPDLVGTNFFTLVYKSKGNSWLSASSERIKVWPVITVTDGRVYYPNHHFVPRNVKESCVTHASKNSDIFDARVCELLPSGTVYAFEFDASRSFSVGTENQDSLIVPGLGRIGSSDTVNVKIRLRLDDQFIDVYDHNYTIFSYYDGSSYRCLIDHSFVGCSTNYQKPSVISRQDATQVLINNRKINCEGVLIIKTEWRSQKIVQPDVVSENMTGYDVPTFMPGSANRHDFHSRPFHFGRGLVMFEYVYTLRGQPPNIGSVQVFHQIARCFLRIRTGVPHMATEGGTFRTMSCLDDFALSIKSNNPNFHSFDFIVFVKCNVTSDRDCDRKKLTVPILRKTSKPECDSYYKFTLEVDYYSSRGLSTITYSTVIHFIERTEELSVTCLYNCLPFINPYKRVIVLAESDPYSPNPVIWQVKNGDTVVTDRYGEVKAFSPLTASRILRLNGSNMQKPGERISNGSFTVYNDELGLIASLDTSCDNINVDVARGFNFNFSDTNEAFNLIPKSPELYAFNPVTFVVYQVNLRVKDELLLVQADYGEQLTNIKPDWNTLRICLRDLWRSEFCKEYTIAINYKDPTTRKVTLEALLQAWQEFDLISILAKSVIFLTQSLTAKSEEFLSWTTSLVDRRNIADIMLKFNLVNQNGARKVFLIVSMLSYSEYGNKAEDLGHFEDEKFQNDLDVIEWMKLRTDTLQLFENTVDILTEWITKNGIFLFRHYLGSTRRLILRTWSLAYHLEYVYLKLMSDVRKSENRYFQGEASFYSYHDDHSLYTILHKIAEFMALRSRLYAGIYFLGNENVLSYVVRTSYAGFLACLDKSGDNRDKDEEFSDYIFEPMVKPKMNWVKLIDLEFPPPPPGWEDKELIFVVIAIKTSLTKYDDDDPDGNPMLVLYLANKNYESIKGIPEGYNVTIPYLDGNGTYLPKEATVGYLRKPIGRENASKCLFLTTVSLPGHLRSWRLKIILEPGVSIKVNASVKELPEYEDALQAPELSVNTSADGKSYSVIDILPVNGRQLIPSKIYLAILAVKMPHPNVPSPIKFQNVLYFCKTFDAVELEDKPCEGLYQPDTLEQHNFKCTCVDFGLVYTSKTRLTGDLVFAGAPDLVIPGFFNQDATIVVTTAVALMVLVMGFALWKGRKRHDESLIYMEDNYVKDSHLLIVGVYTSPRCSAGTTSKVAIKVEGLNSSSRNHMLLSSKRKTLQSGQDNWFVMTTNEPLGRLSRVQLWADFRSRDDWHCSRILLYDVSVAKWYCVEVNKWIYLAESKTEESLISTFQVTEMESTDNPSQSLPYGFCDHFYREISNSHLVLSMALLHHRSLKTPFMIGNVLLIKIFSMFLSIWCLEEVAYTWFHNNFYLDYYSASQLIGLKSRTIENASASAGLTRLFTVPVISLYKAIYVSRFIQKRTTNPLYMETPSSLFASSKKSIASLKGRRSSVFTFRSRKSTKLSIYKPFDTKFGLQKGWRLVATLLFGPSQLRCVNVEANVINNRVFSKLLILRVGTAAFVFVLLAAICYIEFGTEYWRKTKSTAFMFLMAVILDSFLITPTFMLISSLISYFILKASNKEVRMINDETKFKQPPCLDFKQYINVATREEYKPNLSTDLEKISKKNLKTLWYFYFLNHIVALLVLGLCIYNIGTRVTNKFNLIASTSESVTHPVELLDRKSFGIDRVNSRTNAVDFIFTNLADVIDKWYNGKSISNNKTTWTLGGYCQPLSAGNLIMLFRKNNSKNYYISADIQDYQELFPPPCGYLSDDSQRTDPIRVVPGKTVNFTKFSDFSMTSRSRESYGFQGHSVTLPISSDWSKYYSTLRNMVDAAVIRRDNCDLRALIFSWNSINIFSKKMLTLNALFEFLPSGVASAKLEIDAVRFHRDGWSSQITKGILSAVFLWNMGFVALLFSISTKHIVQDRILNCFFLIGSIIVAILHAIAWEAKYKKTHQIIYDPPDRFRDLGSVYAYDRAWSYTMATLIIVTTLIMAFLVLRTAGVRLIKMSYYCVLSSGFMLGIVSLVHLCTEAFRSAIHVIAFKPLFSRIDAVLLDHSTAPSIGLLVTMFLVLAVLYKLTTASVIIASMYVENEESNVVPSLRKRNLSKLNRNRKTDENLTDKPLDTEKTVEHHRVDDKLSLMI